MTATTEKIWTTILNLPRSLASMVKPSEAAMERKPLTRNSRPMMTTAIHAGTSRGIELHQGDEGGGDQQFVGQWVEKHAHGGDLAALAGEIAINAVGDGGGDEQRSRQNFFFAVHTGRNDSVDSTQISTGMLRMRMSVMELGRFTGETRGIRRVDRDHDRLSSAGIANAMEGALAHS